MPKLLDTSVLIHFWQRQIKNLPLDRASAADARKWAEALERVYQTRMIVTPVKVEFLVGVRSQHEFELAQAYLDHFRILDGHRVTPEDWEVAIQFAQRVPPDGKPRQLGDCLIRALAKHFNHDVETHDSRFKR